MVDHTDQNIEREQQPPRAWYCLFSYILSPFFSSSWSLNLTSTVPAVRIDEAYEHFQHRCNIVNLQKKVDSTEKLQYTEADLNTIQVRAYQMALPRFITNKRATLQAEWPLALKKLHVTSWLTFLFFLQLKTFNLFSNSLSYCGFSFSWRAGTLYIISAMARLFWYSFVKNMIAPVPVQVHSFRYWFAEVNFM